MKTIMIKQIKNEWPIDVSVHRHDVITEVDEQYDPDDVPTTSVILCRVCGKTWRPSEYSEFDLDDGRNDWAD